MTTIERKPWMTVTIADCEVQTFRSGGKGGQNQNKPDTGVRVIHHPSGARGESREERSQLQNKRSAFIRMVDTGAFRAWIRTQGGREALIQERVDREMRPERLRVEVKDASGRWAKEES